MKLSLLDGDSGKHGTTAAAAVVVADEFLSTAGNLLCWRMLSMVLAREVLPKPMPPSVKTSTCE